MDNFTLDIKKWADKTEKGLVETNEAALVELNSRIIYETPVDKGQHRGAWTASIGSPSFGSGIDKSGNKTVGKANAVASKAPGHVYYLSNNAPAIRKLEYGEFTTKASTDKTINGYSKQAPQGMVRKAFKELKREIDSVKTK